MHLYHSYLHSMRQDKVPSFILISKLVKSQVSVWQDIKNKTAYYFLDTPNTNTIEKKYLKNEFQEHTYLRYVAGLLIIIIPGITCPAAADDLCACAKWSNIYNSAWYKCLGISQKRKKQEKSLFCSYYLHVIESEPPPPLQPEQYYRQEAFDNIAVY